MQCTPPPRVHVVPRFGFQWHVIDLYTSLVPLWNTMLSQNNETVIGSIWVFDLVGLKSYLSIIYMNAYGSTTILKTHVQQFNSKSKKQHSHLVLKKIFSLNHNLSMQGQHGSSLWTTQLENILYNYSSIKSTYNIHTYSSTMQNN